MQNFQKWRPHDLRPLLRAWLHSWRCRPDRHSCEAGWAVIEVTKICQKCGALFSGRRCQPCWKTYSAKYYQANKDKISARNSVNSEAIAARNKAWQLVNADSQREKKAVYRKNNTEKLRVINAAWRAKNAVVLSSKKSVYRSLNRDKVDAKIAEWHASNPSARKASRQNRRAKLKASNGRLSRGIVTRLMVLQRGKCACCHQAIEDSHHLDHVFPLALGGANIDDNIQLLCPRCNLQKNAKHPVDFMQSKGFLL